MAALRSIVDGPKPGLVEAVVRFSGIGEGGAMMNPKMHEVLVPKNLLLLLLLLLLFFEVDFGWVKHRRVDHLVADGPQRGLNAGKKFMQPLLEHVGNRE